MKRERKTVYICALIPAVLFLLATELLAQEEGTPVPPDWVASDPTYGDTLTVRSLNFTITAPHGRRWLQVQLPDIEGEKPIAFIAAGSDTEPEYSVIVLGKESTAIKPADLEKDIRGVAFPEGWTLVDVQAQGSLSPIVGSAKFRAKLRNADDEEIYEYGYSVPGRFSYTLVTYVPEEVEPLAFSTFAGSLKFLDPSQSTASQSDSDQTDNNPMNGVSVLLLVAAIVGAVSDRSYLRAGGVRPTSGDRLYLAVGSLSRPCR